MSVAVNPPKTPVTEGSNAIAAATLPNVCKMPGPPAPFVPTPLPNIGKSSSSPQGYSTTVTIEGNAVAIKGATFSSMGDVASQGTGGGLISSNVEGPTSFIAPGSLDVAIEGKAVQLLGDQMLNNCGPSGSPANAATMSGTVQPPAPPVIVDGENITQMTCECAEEKPYSGVANIPVDDWLKCCILGKRREQCVQGKIEDAQKKGKLKELHMPAGANYGSDDLPEGQKYCRPDIVLGPGPKPLDAANMTGIIEMKFPCNKTGQLPSQASWSPRKALSKAQERCYQSIKLPGGDAKPKGVEVTPCGPTKEACNGGSS